MRIAVFADVHGRILLAFKLVARYQRETGEHIDLILQCGDMGIFPDIATLDKGNGYPIDSTGRYPLWFRALASFPPTSPR